MKVNLPGIEVTDEFRKTFNEKHGKPGLASRDAIRDRMLLAMQTDLQLFGTGAVFAGYHAPKDGVVPAPTEPNAQPAAPVAETPSAEG